jgi:hypothetical protein
LAKDARPTLLGAQDRQCLNKLPKSQLAKAKRALEQIWMAETKRDALAAFDAFVEIYDIKYEKAVGMPDQRPRCFARLLRLPGLRTS